MQTQKLDNDTEMLIEQQQKLSSCTAAAAAAAATDRSNRLQATH